MDADDRTHRTSRRLNATTDRVFAAFTDPDLLKRWLPPQGMTGVIEHFDLAPGGSYRMALIYDRPDDAAKSGGNSDIVEGTFVAIEPPHRLVQKVVFESDDPAFAGEMTMIWEVAPLQDGSLVTMTAENVPSGISEADHIAGMNSSLENLARLLEG